MKMRSFIEAPDPATGKALEAFEREFSYPLGERSRFHISHQPNYLRFFQAIGKPHLLTAETNEEIQGSLVTVARGLSLDGSALTAHYFCDLKLRAAARGSRVLAHLFTATQQRIRTSDSVKCYGVVMKGTGSLPSDYTGRLDIPRFQRIGEIAILRLNGVAKSSPGVVEVSIEEMTEISRRIANRGYRATGGDSRLRSQIVPVALAKKDGSACGTVEDTRRAKRLIQEDGGEMISAHLSGFTFATPKAGVELLGHALTLANQNGLPALFAAVPVSQANAVVTLLESAGVAVTIAPASIFGHDLEAGHDWWVDTAEI